MFESMWFTIALLLAVHTHGALAANDIDETVAIVIFAILIAIFSGIAIVFAFLIIRLKRQDWQAVRDQYDAPQLNKRQRDVNSNHSITGFNQRQQPELDTGMYERKTASDFSAVYVNSGYSNEIDSVLVTTTTSTFQQPASGKEELKHNQQNSTEPNFSNTQNTSNGGHFITMNVSFVDEDPTVIQAHTETENVPSSVVDEKLDAKLSTTNGEISATATDKDVDSDKKSYSGIANGVAGDGKTHSSVAGSHQDPTVSNTATKRKSFGALFKRQESRESQKPLLFSQSSTVSSVTMDSPAVGGLSHQMSSSALPDAFDERDEQENEESKL